MAKRTRKRGILRQSEMGDTNILVLVIGGLILVALGAFLGVTFSKTNSITPANETVSQQTLPLPSPAFQTDAKHIYTDSKTNISFNYPSDWDYQVMGGNEDIVFKPTSMTIPEQTEAQVPVDVQLNKETYAAVVERLTSVYGTEHNEMLSWGSVSGVHIWGTITQVGPAQDLSGGAFVLNNNGKAIQFSYEVIDGKNYMPIAREMIHSIQF